MEGLLGEPRVLGVGEMMNYPGLLAGEADMLAKLRLGRRRRVDGHCPGLSGKDLQAYAGLGVGSDHESTRAEEAREKLEAGLYVMVREGSAARSLARLARLIRPENVRRFLLVSDDLGPDDLLRLGHMDHILREAIRLGVHPLWALQMVTLNPAEYFGLADRGAVAPGKRADLVTFDRLDRPHIRDVFVAGELVAREGRLLRPWPPPRIRGARGGLRVPPSALGHLAVRARGRRIRVIRAFPDQILTGSEVHEARVEGGQVVPDPERDILKVALFERHRGTGRVGVGFVRGFGLREGGLASTVAHDAHNLIALGASDAEIRAAAEAAIRMGGGMVAVRGGAVLAALPLPLWGLMSDRPAAEVASRKGELRAAARALGSSLPQPFLTLSFLALSVIPALRISDRGLVDATRFRRVSLFVR